MKIIILAAGIGSRLGNPFPKPLTKLKNHKSIMQMMTENISFSYSLDLVNLVVGFKKDLIMESFPNLTYIYNQYFDQTNTAKRLIGVPAIPPLAQGQALTSPKLLADYDSYQW